MGRSAADPMRAEDSARSITSSIIGTVSRGNPNQRSSFRTKDRSFRCVKHPTSIEEIVQTGPTDFQAAGQYKFLKTARSTAGAFS